MFRLLTATFAVVVLFGSSTFADVKAVQEGTKAKTAADTANDIYSVKYLNVGKTSFKVVSMNTSLNGDLSDTTILLAQEGGVGGEAYYENAFQLTPNHDEDLRSLKTVRSSQGKLIFQFSSFSGVKLIKKAYAYNAASKTLVEIK